MSTTKQVSQRLENFWSPSNSQFFELFVHLISHQLLTTACVQVAWASAKDIFEDISEGLGEKKEKQVN